MSKANQKFVQADEAVSPVIGVILMVAITVVLAAVVFVLVSNLSKTNESAPTMGFTTDDSADRIQLTTAPQNLNWNEFKIKASTDAVLAYAMNTNNGLTGTGISTTATAFASLAVTGGDFIDICGDTNGSTAAGGAAVTSPITVQIIHTATNTEVYSADFSTVSACA